MKKHQAVFAGLLLFLAGGVMAAGQNIFFTSGPSSRKAIALTFDDGPGPQTTAVLDVLDRYKVKATFFMEGDQVEFRRPLAQQVASRGHEIGSHTYSHPDFYHYKKPDREQKLDGELQKTSQLIDKAVGVKPVLVRMPHGYVRDWVKEVAGRHNVILVNWTFGCDWQKMPADKLAEEYIRNIRPGAIFLMHDGGGHRERTVEALPKVIEAARAQGYEIVPVSELLGMKAQQAPVQMRRVEAKK